MIGLLVGRLAELDREVKALLGVTAPTARQLRRTVKKKPTPSALDRVAASITPSASAPAGRAATAGAPASAPLPAAAGSVSSVSRGGSAASAKAPAGTGANGAPAPAPAAAPAPGLAPTTASHDATALSTAGAPPVAAPSPNAGGSTVSAAPADGTARADAVAAPAPSTDGPAGGAGGGAAADPPAADAPSPGGGSRPNSAATRNRFRSVVHKLITSMRGRGSQLLQRIEALEARPHHDPATARAALDAVQQQLTARIDSLQAALEEVRDRPTPAPAPAPAPMPMPSNGADIDVEALQTALLQRCESVSAAAVQPVSSTVHIMQETLDSIKLQLSGLDTRTRDAAQRADDLVEAQKQTAEAAAASAAAAAAAAAEPPIVTKEAWDAMNATVAAQGATLDAHTAALDELRSAMERVVADTQQQLGAVKEDQRELLSRCNALSDIQSSLQEEVAKPPQVVSAARQPVYAQSSITTKQVADMVDSLASTLSAAATRARQHAASPSAASSRPGSPPDTRTSNNQQDTMELAVARAGAAAGSSAARRSSHNAVAAVATFVGQADALLMAWPSKLDGSLLHSGLTTTCAKLKDVSAGLKASPRAGASTADVVAGRQQALRGAITSFYALLALEWPPPDAATAGADGALDAVSDLRGVAETALESLEAALLLQAFEALGGVLKTRYQSKLDVPAAGAATASLEQEAAARQELAAQVGEVEHRFQTRVDAVEANMELLEAQRRALRMVQASLANAHELVKGLRTDVSRTVSKSQMQTALEEAMRTVHEGGAEMVTGALQDDLAHILNGLDGKANSVDVGRLRDELRMTLSQMESVSHLVVPPGPDGTARPAATVSTCLSCHRPYVSTLPRQGSFPTLHGSHNTATAAGLHPRTPFAAAVEDTRASQSRPGSGHGLSRTLFPPAGESPAPSPQSGLGFVLQPRPGSAAPSTPAGASARPASRDGGGASRGLHRGSTSASASPAAKRSAPGKAVGKQLKGGIIVSPARQSSAPVTRSAWKHVVDGGGAGAGKPRSPASSPGSPAAAAATAAGGVSQWET